MTKFFKEIEKRPFTYQTIIEERKGNINYKAWIGGVIVLIVVSSIVYLLFK